MNPHNAPNSRPNTIAQAAKTTSTIWRWVMIYNDKVMNNNEGKENAKNKKESII